MDSNAFRYQQLSNTQAKLNPKDNRHKNFQSMDPKDSNRAISNSIRGTIDNNGKKDKIKGGNFIGTGSNMLSSPFIQYNNYPVNWPGSSQQNYNSIIVNYSVPTYAGISPSTLYLNPYPTQFLVKTVETAPYVTQLPYNSNNFITGQSPYFSYEKTNLSYNSYLRGLHEAKYVDSNHNDISNRFKESVSESSAFSKVKKLIDYYSSLTQFFSCKDPINYINSLKGSRHLQKLIQKNETEAYTLYEYIANFINEVIFNVYGNYVVKKVFSLLKANQRARVWGNLEKNISSFCVAIHSHHSIIMLISKSETDVETDKIEGVLIPFFSELIINEQGISVLAELVSKLDFRKKTVRIVNYICDSIIEILQNKAAVALCKKLITRLDDEGNNQLHLNCLIKAIIPHLLKLNLAEGLNDLLFQILDNWNLARCPDLTKALDSNFILLAIAPSSSPIILKYLSVLELKVSAN